MSIIIFMFLIVTIVALASTVLLAGNSQSSDDYDYSEHCYYENLIDDGNRMNDEMFQQFMREQEQLIIDQQMQEFMDFSMKSVTPFEQGGFDMTQGNSFNDFGF